MSTPIQISVVICTYNRAAYLTDALNSLYQQTLSKDLFEVIIVNNNSTDNTETICRDYIQSHPDFKVIYLNENEQGASYARNTGAAKAIAPLLCFMDDDAIANSDYLSRIVHFFEIHQGVGGLGGRIIPKYIPAEPKWMSRYVASMVGHFDYSPQVVAFKPGKYPLESNMVVPKKLFDTINGFNTALPGVKGELRIGGEGKDFFFRLQALGHAIYYDPNIVVQHVVEVSKLTPAYLYRVASGYGRGERVRTLQKNNLAFLLKIVEYCFKLGAAFVLGLIYLLRGEPAKSWPVIRFRIDALKGLFNL